MAKKLTREELEQWALRHGYTKDRWGHFQKVKADAVTARMYRLKISKYSVRKELSGGTSVGWIFLSSGYIRDLNFNEKDQLCGMSANGCKPNPRKSF